MPYNAVDIARYIANKYIDYGLKKRRRCDTLYLVSIVSELSIINEREAIL